jgi:hypothetical protein
MLLPELKSPENPDAPVWAEVEFASQHEYEGMKQSLAAIVGYDDREGYARYVLMGTGSIVGFIPGNGVFPNAGLYVSTATHVVMGFVNLFSVPCRTTTFTLAITRLYSNWTCSSSKRLSTPGSSRL